MKQNQETDGGNFYSQLEFCGLKELGEFFFLTGNDGIRSEKFEKPGVAIFKNPADEKMSLGTTDINGGKFHVFTGQWHNERFDIGDRFQTDLIPPAVDIF